MHVQTTEAGNNLHKCISKFREFSNQRLGRGEGIEKRQADCRCLVFITLVEILGVLCVSYAVELPSFVELTFSFSNEVTVIFPIASEYRHVFLRLHPSSLRLCRQFKATERKI